MGGGVGGRRAGRRARLVGGPLARVGAQEQRVDPQQPGHDVADPPRQDRAEDHERPDRLRDVDLEARIAQRLHDRLGHLLRRDAAHGPRVRHARRQLGVHQPGQHHGELDAGAAQLRTDRLGEADDAELAGAVGRRAGKARAPGRGGDVDDVAASSRAHAPDPLASAVDHGMEVELELADGGVVVLGLERAQRHDAGVVDQHVDRPQRRLDVVEGGGERRSVADVEGQRARRLADLGRHRGGRIAVEVEDRHRGALEREVARQGGADAAAGAGDHGDLTGERAG
ncbi:MAG: hypothetical protein AVDCRST_MAG38-871 [uncultured Solirubrobacteraceae bacterium]|uniref:Uncharacterized protein n=1 Tax=uncultured Solirubrobacteraceae bacterium TaxID=1162706 RepID=A0A6J4RAS0_9ACTN|nr:MAG: hypothetical protein AVDCRST_MAG38-871 [uncultured Solirubrobacteraceae bacterium]